MASAVATDAYIAASESAAIQRSGARAGVRGGRCGKFSWPESASSMIRFTVSGRPDVCTLRRMSLALWPVFEDSRTHGLTDEGVTLLESPLADPLLRFDAYAALMIPESSTVDPDELVAGIEPSWYEPSDAIRTISDIRTTLGPSNRELAHALDALESVLMAASARSTRFHFTVA
jgi:hypothetical protein